MIDLFGLTAEEVRLRFPRLYQYLIAKVKSKRDLNPRETYRKRWWVFGEPRIELRSSLDGLGCYIAIGETGTHRIFQFVESAFVPDNMVIVVASSDPFHLGVLISRAHVCWALRSGGWQGEGNDPRYTKSRCFDPFPFPDAHEESAQEIRHIAEELDAFRKRQQAEHPDLTLTAMYNVLEKLRADTTADAFDADDRRTLEDGLVLVLKELHDQLDAAVAKAYGWPADLPDEEILARLVALNQARAAEEARGQVRWLRPDYQIPRFGTAAQKRQRQIEAELVVVPAAPQKPLFPTTDAAQTAAVMAALAAASGPVDPAALAASFRQGRRVEPKVAAVLRALARMGYVAALDGGRTYRLRRAA